MSRKLRRRTALGMIGSTALAGCSELGSIAGVGCSYGEGETNRSFDETIDLGAGESIARTLQIEPCDELTVTVDVVTMLDDEPQGDYVIEAVLLDEENYQEFQDTQDVTQWTMWDSENGSEDWTRLVADRSTFVYRLERGRDPWTAHLVLANGPPDDGYPDRPVRVELTGTLIAGG